MERNDLINSRKTTMKGMPFFILALSLSLTFLGCGKEEIITKSRILMDTVVTVKVVHSDSKKANKAIEAVFREIERIDRLMDFCDPKSEVSRINNGHGGEFKVSLELIEVISESLKYSRITNGAFDISIGPVTRLWDFKEGRLPDRDRLKEALESVDYKRIKIDKEKGMIRLGSCMMIDLGGVAKGYAVTKAIDLLKGMGITSALIDAGGDIEVIGKKFGHPWRIGIQHPRKKDEILRTIELDKGGVATSGDYERFFIINGRRYHHIIDPATGYPAIGCISVTVTAPSCFLADILSTAVFVLGPDKGMRLIKKMEGVEGIIVTENAILSSIVN